jgi:hypothetical protein
VEDIVQGFGRQREGTANDGRDAKHGRRSLFFVVARDKTGSFRFCNGPHFIEDRVRTTESQDCVGCGVSEINDWTDESALA